VTIQTRDRHTAEPEQRHATKTVITSILSAFPCGNRFFCWCREVHSQTDYPELRTHDWGPGGGGSLATATFVCRDLQRQGFKATSPKLVDERRIYEPASDALTFPANLNTCRRNDGKKKRTRCRPSGATSRPTHPDYANTPMRSSRPSSHQHNPGRHGQQSAEQQRLIMPKMGLTMTILTIVRGPAGRRGCEVEERTRRPTEYRSQRKWAKKPTSR